MDLLQRIICVTLAIDLLQGIIDVTLAIDLLQGIISVKLAIYLLQGIISVSSPDRIKVNHPLLLISWQNQCSVGVCWAV